MGAAGRKDPRLDALPKCSMPVPLWTFEVHFAAHPEKLHQITLGIDGNHGNAGCYHLFGDNLGRPGLAASSSANYSNVRVDHARIEEYWRARLFQSADVKPRSELRWRRIR